MNYMIYDGDLPDGYDAGAAIAIDTETLGLNPHRDRLCLVQMSRGDGSADLVQIRRGQTRAPNLEAVLTNPAITKLFHFGRFDIAILEKAFGVVTTSVYCTKIASRLARTSTDRHGLKDLWLICPNSSNPLTGVLKNSAMPRLPMPRPMCCICTPCVPN